MFICVHLWIIFLTSCGSKPADPRTIIPADSLVYLETSDLGKLLDTITSNSKFLEVAKTKPDTSALNGIRLSVAVTGFRASREEVSEDKMIGHIRPQFVAVAETNAWNYQALGFAENKLGEFVNDIYDGEVELVTTDKHHGKYFTWTARDGRKAFALVRGSLILFGNDETAIDNCVNVMNGGADSIAENATVSAFSQDLLASGYVSKSGVAQIANIAGASFAISAGEEAEVRGFISRVLPEIVRNSVTEASWRARRLEDGRVEDSYWFALAPETARIISETIVPGDRQGYDPVDPARFVPQDFVSTTRYGIRDSQVAWRGLLLTARTKTDQVSGNLFVTFASSLFEPYGIENPELFLSGISEIYTVRFDTEGDEVVAIAKIKEPESVKMGAAKELGFTKPLTPPDLSRWGLERVWRSVDGELAAVIYENIIIIGEAGSVDKCIAAFKASGSEVPDVRSLRSSTAAAATTGREADPQARLVTILTSRNVENAVLTQTYTTETRLNQNGIERRTVSDFGLIGTIVERLDSGN